MESKGGVKVMVRVEGMVLTITLLESTGNLVTLGQDLARLICTPNH